MPRHLNSPDPRREYQQGRILAAIASEPLTAQQLADRLHLSRDMILRHLAMLMAEVPRRLHVAGFETTIARPAPKYGPGDLPDAVYVPTRAPTRQNEVDEQTERAAAELKACPMTTSQLADKLGLSVSRTRFYVATLRADGKAYIKAWNAPPCGGDLAPVYGLGNRPDKPKARKTGAQRYRELKADPEKHERNLAKRRVLYRIRKSTRAPQTWCSALM